MRTASRRELGVSKARGGGAGTTGVCMGFILLRPQRPVPADGRRLTQAVLCLEWGSFKAPHAPTLLRRRHCLFKSLPNEPCIRNTARFSASLHNRERQPRHFLLHKLLFHKPLSPSRAIPGTHRRPGRSFPRTERLLQRQPNETL